MGVARRLKLFIAGDVDAETNQIERGGRRQLNWASMSDGW